MNNSRSRVLEPIEKSNTGTISNQVLLIIYIS